MSWTGVMPRPTRMTKIYMTYHDSRSASAAHSPSIMSMRAWALSRSTDRSCQYHLRHLQVHSPQVEKSLAFLQCSAKVFESFRLRTGGAYLGGKVLLDGIRTGAISAAFRAHLPEHTRKVEIVGT
jgi:hypothetical protein